MNVLTIIRKEYPITVLKFQIKDLDKSRCSYKFQQYDIDGENEIYVKCDNDGNIDYRGKKQEYRLYDLHKHERK